MRKFILRLLGAAELKEVEQLSKRLSDIASDCANLYNSNKELEKAIIVLAAEQQEIIGDINDILLSNDNEDILWFFDQEDTWH